MIKIIWVKMMEKAFYIAVLILIIATSLPRIRGASFGFASGLPIRFMQRRTEPPTQLRYSGTDPFGPFGDPFG